MTADSLSSLQTASLYDILTHASTYSEIRDFRHPSSLDSYGPPFSHSPGVPSTSPALQALVSRFLLPLPGLKDLPPTFWQTEIHSLITSLEAADLSESYDKGVLGSRKTLATAISALIEYPIRATYAGLNKPTPDAQHVYDTSNADDLSRAFRDFMHHAVYDSALDDLATKAAETDRLSDHDPIVQAVHEYVLVNIASFMHYTLILSPKGQYLLKLIESANKLVPYLAIRQTLKIGNVATMISAMMRVVLAKVSVASVTNWIGLTQTEDDGQNLVQHIISQVLGWDNRDLESRAVKIEKSLGTGGKEQLQVLKEYVSRSREEHEWLRGQSQKQARSIVTVILDDADLGTSKLSAETHKQLLSYLSVQLSLRDRNALLSIFCTHHPDHFTSSIKSLVAAYEPVIRQVHDAVDLSETVGDAEKFIRDTIKVAKITTPKDGTNVTPSVGDFVQLLKKHASASHRFIHQVCKNGKAVTGWYLDWVRGAAGYFRRKSPTSKGPKDGENEGAGDLTEPLNALFNALPHDKREAILPILDQHGEYVDELHDASRTRLASVLRSQPSGNPAIKRILMDSASGSRGSSRSASPAPSLDGERLSEKEREKTPVVVESTPGPGSYLARWQDLLDSTLITPLTPDGPVEGGGGADVVNESAGTVMGEKTMVHEGGDAELAKGQKNKKPDVLPVLDTMLKDFRELLGERACDW